jgi:hypothetical protein
MLMRAGSTPAVRRRLRTAGAQAGAHGDVHPVLQALELDVPQPRDVGTVGEAVVDRDHQRAPAGLGEHRAQHLGKADGILDQCQEDLSILHGNPLDATERRGERLEAARDQLTPYT